MSRPPTDGWPRKCLAFSDARTADCVSLQCFLLAFVAFEDRTEAARTLASAACVAAHETEPNVRHERRRKGREAAFVTSARWRG